MRSINKISKKTKTIVLTNHLRSRNSKPSEKWTVVRKSDGLQNNLLLQASVFIEFTIGMGVALHEHTIFIAHF